MSKNTNAAPAGTGNGNKVSCAFDSKAHAGQGAIRPAKKPASATPATPEAPARQHFTLSRAVEYFLPRELEAQTGQPIGNFAGKVAPKELLDNALDAAEAAGRPPVVEIAAHFDAEAGSLALSVSDNGNGIPPAVVGKIADFTTRTSDKAAYRGPARGAQGNALKTIIGLPVAMGAERSRLTIITRETLHRIAAWIDPAQQARIGHETEPAPDTQGTAVALALPDHRAVVAESMDRLAFAYHCLNPHAEVRIRLTGTALEQGEMELVEIADFYQPTTYPPTDTAWAKFRSRDPEPPHWHDAESFARLVQLTIHAGGDLPLRAFVRQFRGLSATAKAAAVCRELPWSRLVELDGNAQAAATLLKAMQGQTTPPAPAVLGIIGEDHLRRAFAHRFELVEGRFWYRKAQGTAAAPFVFEVALAEIRGTQEEPVFGLNFAPTFGDPFAGTRFATAGRYGYGYGLSGIVSANLADRQVYALVAHLTAPGLRFLDRGKSRLAIADREMIAAIAKAMDAVLKTFREEGERALKDARRQAKEDSRRLEVREEQEERPREISLRAAVFRELAKAVTQARGPDKLPTGPRTVFYQIRPLIAAHTAEELGYGYFSQTLIPDYEAEHGKIEGLYADPRGFLYLPRSENGLPIGDRLVEGFVFPDWVFDKILFVEKKGLFPTLRAAHLMERYDLAIVAGEGFASVAIRTLLAKANERDIKVFVLHDCDVDGYNIARTLSQETRRMPDHRIEVIDLGLRLEKAKALDLPHEEYTRRKALPDTLELTTEEHDFFIKAKTGKNQWAARRVELNALDASQLVALVEAGLKEAGADGKLIPPDFELTGCAESAMSGRLENDIREEIERQIDIEALVEQVRARVIPHLPRPHRAKLKRAVEIAFRPKTEKRPEGRYRAKHWGAPASDHAIRRYQTADLPRLVSEAVTQALGRAQRINALKAAKPTRAAAMALSEGRAG